MQHDSKEKSKFGSGSRTIAMVAVELVSTDPNNTSNIQNLPAGYLKCDGTKYQAEDYPVLTIGARQDTNLEDLILRVMTLIN